jgi:hypothetical protein
MSWISVVTFPSLTVFTTGILDVQASLPFSISKTNVSARAFLGLFRPWLSS